MEKFKESNTAVTYEERIQKELSREEDSVEEKWTNIKNAIISTAETALGPAIVRPDRLGSMKNVRQH